MRAGRVRDGRGGGGAATNQSVRKGGGGAGTGAHLLEGAVRAGHRENRHAPLLPAGLGLLRHPGERSCPCPSLVLC